jgi:hypothetical protein
MYTLLNEKNYVTGFAEVDITEALLKISSNENITVTGWLIKVTAEFVAKNLELNSYRKGRSKLITFNEVDIVTFVEHNINGELVPFPYTIRKAQHKTAREITQLLKKEKARKDVIIDEQLLGQEKLISIAYKFLPRWLRLKIMRRKLYDPGL